MAFLFNKHAVSDIPPPAKEGEQKVMAESSVHYADAHAHLLDELRWLNRLLAAHVLRLRRVNFHDNLKDFRGFFIADEEIDALLAEGIFEADGAGSEDGRGERITQLLLQAQNLRREIRQKIKAAEAQSAFLPLAHLAKCFALGELEQQALVICLAPHLDARYEKLYAYLQNDVTKKFPGVDLILGLLCQRAEERLRHLAFFNPAAPLRHFNLLESPENASAASAAQQSLRADPRIVHYVTGDNAIDSRVLPDWCFLPPVKWNQLVVDVRLRQRLQKLFQLAMNSDTDRLPILHLYGRPGIGKKTLARALCSEMGLKLAVADVRSLLRAPETFREKARLLLREGLLQPCAVYFDHIEKLEIASEENPSLFSALIQEISESGWMTFWGSENPLSATLLAPSMLFPIAIPAPDHAAQKQLWEKHLDGMLAESERHKLSQLTASFNLTGGQIIRAVRSAQQAALVREPEKPHVTFEDLLMSSRVQSQPKLSTLARKISPHFRWSDLVLPEDQMSQLRELANQAKRRQIVMEDWGFNNKLTLGRGLSALFVGPSGTGKTMAAEVMANDLGLDLYKIDLSAVVSKYIGETEKNLNRVFTEAEHSNAILFFDEADALLGKRSEVRDAHDRYANIEIAYLLQKMEEYEGITILATNLRQNIDEAFTRRIRFIIEFPFPEEEYRLRIWQGIWPKETPLAREVDLHFIARQFKLTGGNIRNIALAAAFLATENGQLVGMKHLLHATKREFQKMGRLVSEEEFRET
jgi:SpoVK/Ycf46/Vps4 family AAA+-type ATPase